MTLGMELALGFTAMVILLVAGACKKYLERQDKQLDRLIDKEDGFRMLASEIKGKVDVLEHIILKD